MPKKPQQLAKLTRPRLYGALPRERLFALLDDARRRKRVICVVGPPGAGKTTLVTSWLDSRRIKGIWYQVDAGDADLSTFFYYLGEAARPFTRKGQRPLPALTSEYLHDVAGYSRRFFRDLFSRLAHGSVVALDNYQEVGPEETFHRIVADAVNELPDGLSLVVISRSDTPTPYARLIANERMGRIDWEALKLDAEEAAAIAARRSGAVQEDIIRMHGMSAGWTAGFVLLLEQLRQGRRPDVAGNSDSLRAIFDYFASQLFEIAPPEVQRLLLRLSFLPRMSVAAAREVTGNPDADAILEEMHRRRLFTDRRETGEAVYQFHALLHAFLQHRASRTLDRTEQTELIRQAAAILDRSGQPAEALSLYLKAGEFQSARELILQEAPKLVGQGRGKPVIDWIEALPGAAASADCWLHYWNGIAIGSMDPVGAREKLERSFALAESAADDLCLVHAAAGIVATYMSQYTHFQPLDRWIAVLEDKASNRLPFSSPDAELRIQSTLIFALGTRQPSNPRMLASRVERVFELLGTSTDCNLRVSAATYLVLYASSTGPTQVGTRALPLLEALLALPEVTPLNAAWGLAAISWFHCLCRNTEACLKACAELEQIAKEEGLPFVTKLATIDRMWAALFDFNVADGRKLLIQLERTTDSAHPFDVASCHGARSWLAICENQPEQAWEHGLQAVQTFDETGSVMHSVNFRLLLVIALFMQGKFDSARHWIDEMREVAGEALTDWQRCSLLMWEANIALEEGDRALMLGKLGEALNAARRHGGDFMFSNWCRPWMPRLCQQALAAGIEVQFVCDLIFRHDFPPPSPDAMNWPWPLKVFTLGGFRLEINGEPAAFGRKAPKKVLALLKAVIAFGGKAVPQKKLIDALWPEEHGDAAQVALGMAIHRLRKLLVRPNAVQVSEGLVSLDSNQCWVDVWALERRMAGDDRQPLSNGANGESIWKLYVGTFLPDDMDSTWVLLMRERIRRDFLRYVLRVGRQSEEAGKLDEALSFYQKGIETDDLAEELYQGLMRCYQKLGRNAEALSVYQRMRHTLWVALGIKPSADTEALIRLLTPQ